MSGLSEFVTDALIRRMAGERSYARGVEYFRDGHVEHLKVTANGIRAVVFGNHLYNVNLTSTGKTLDYDCDCPYGSEGEFCKHCVAAALTWLARDKSVKPAKAGRGTKPKPPTMADAQRAMLALAHDELVRKVMEWAKDDDKLRGRILALAPESAGPNLAIETARRVLQIATAMDSDLDDEDYGERDDCLREAAGILERLLDDGYAAEVLELCESAFPELSEDEFGGGDAVDRLQGLHLRACEKTRPDPVALAGRLFEFGMSSGLSVFLDACEPYSRVLGTKGIQEYRRLAEKEWALHPLLGAEDRFTLSDRRFRIVEIMESLAESPEALAAVMAKDLSSPGRYAAIVQVLEGAGLHHRALEWAEKGISAFPGQAGNFLRELAVEEYHRLGRHDDAVQLTWDGFQASPRLETYQSLENHAKKANKWNEWRAVALSEIRRRVGEQKQAWKATRSRGNRPDHTLLVAVFLHERDDEAAWSEALEGGCSNPLWLRLAEARELTHPDDAAAVYLQQAERAIVEGGDSTYAETGKLLVRAAGLMKKMGRAEEFTRDLEALRRKYKQRRNFIKLLDSKRKSLYLS